MAGSFFCRKCLRTGTVKFVTGLSRIASSPTPPSSFDTPIAGEHLEGNNYINNAVAIVVIAVAGSALLSLGMFLWLFRCNRLSNHHRARAAAAANASSTTAAVVQVTMMGGQPQEESAEKGLDDEGPTGGGKWSAKWVELVVMAGEDRPTFVAHPVPAAAVCERAVVECPPSQITTLGGSS